MDLTSLCHMILNQKHLSERSWPTSSLQSYLNTVRPLPRCQSVLAEVAKRYQAIETCREGRVDQAVVWAAQKVVVPARGGALRVQPPPALSSVDLGQNGECSQIGIPGRCRHAEKQASSLIQRLVLERSPAAVDDRWRVREPVWSHQHRHDCHGGALADD